MVNEMEPYQALANAIVLSAVTDYRKALKRYSANQKNRNAAADVKSLERFFFSSWFEVLTDVDPHYLVKKLKEEVNL